MDTDVGTTPLCQPNHPQLDPSDNSLVKSDLLSSYPTSPTKYHLLQSHFPHLQAQPVASPFPLNPSPRSPSLADTSRARSLAPKFTGLLRFLLCYTAI